MRHRLPGQGEDRGRVLGQQCQLPAFGGLDRVRRAEHLEVWDRAQRRQMLDRLMRRAILAQADTVMRHDVDHALAHERGQPDRRAAIVGEDEEGRAIRHDAAMKCQTVHGGGHAVLAHPPMHVVAFEVLARDRGVMRGLGVIGAGQIGRAAKQPRHHRHQRLQHLLRGDPGGALGLFGRERCLVVLHGLADGRLDIRVDGIAEPGEQFSIELGRRLGPRHVCTLAARTHSPP